MPGQVGPITVFFMPGEAIRGEMEIDSARFQGYLVPTDWGSIAVVGAQSAYPAQIEREFVNAVEWET